MSTTLATRCGAALWVVAAVGYLIFEAVAAAGFAPAYSYAHNYISDLGVSAVSPRSYLMHAAFYLQGILFFLGALLIVGFPESPRARIFLGLITANSIGNIVIGTVHSGNVHRAGAALAIVGGNTAILAGSASDRDGWWLALVPSHLQTLSGPWLAESADVDDQLGNDQRPTCCRTGRGSAEACTRSSRGSY